MHPEVPVDLIVSGLVGAPSSEAENQDSTDTAAGAAEAVLDTKSSGDPSMTLTEKTTGMTFEEFRGTKECLPLQEAYESSKAAIKHNKARQIELVNVVNGYKQNIDANSEITKRYKRQQKRLADGAPDQDGEAPEALVTGAEFEAAAAELEASKLGYREAHAELQALRQEADELAAQKRQALEEIASAYQMYVNPLS
jgi:chromosome segregation ATPase